VKSSWKGLRTKIRGGVQDDRRVRENHGKSNFRTVRKENKKDRYSAEDNRFSKKTEHSYANGLKDDEKPEFESIFKRNKRLYKSEKASDKAKDNDKGSFFKKRKNGKDSRSTDKARGARKKSKKR